MDKKNCSVPCLMIYRELTKRLDKDNIKLTEESKKNFFYNILKSLGLYHAKILIQKAALEGLLDWNEEYEVEQVLDHCTDEKGEKHYLIKWQGWDPKFNSWEPESHLKCTQLLEDFHKAKNKKRKLETLEQNATVDALFKKIEKNVKDYDKLLLMTSDYSQRKRKVRSTRASAPKKLSKIESLQALKKWETEINAIAKGYDRAYLFVENKVDFEGPPENFVYINERKEGHGVEIPKDPLIGCNCQDCYKDRKMCCPAQSDSTMAYYKSRNQRGRLRVDLGVPIYECNRLCKCGPDCLNRVVQKGRKYKLCIFRTANSRGWGVKTLQFIKKGSFVIEYVGEVITNEEAEKRGHYYDNVGRTYLFDLDFNETDAAYTIDAGTYGNAAHFINHSCDPNLAVHAVWINCLDPQFPHICLFAKRDIKVNEELTFDYLSENEQLIKDVPKASSTEFQIVPTPPSSDTDSLSSEINATSSKSQMLCLCGSSKCRKYLFF